jgi:hypothetical protein
MAPLLGMISPWRPDVGIDSSVLDIVFYTIERKLRAQEFEEMAGKIGRDIRLEVQQVKVGLVVDFPSGTSG